MAMKETLKCNNLSEHDLYIRLSLSHCLFSGKFPSHPSPKARHNWFSGPLFLVYVHFTDNIQIFFLVGFSCSHVFYYFPFRLLFGLVSHTLIHSFAPYPYGLFLTDFFFCLHQLSHGLLFLIFCPFFLSPLSLLLSFCFPCSPSSQIFSWTLSSLFLSLMDPQVLFMCIWHSCLRLRTVRENPTRCLVSDF